MDCGQSLNDYVLIDFSTSLKLIKLLCLRSEKCKMDGHPLQLC